MIVHQPSRSLLLKVKPTTEQQLRELFPKFSKPIDYQGHNLAVPHNLAMVKVLRNLGIKAPSPIRTEYDWPRPARFTNIFDHQYDTAEFLTLHPRCFVLNEQGTSKTASALWACDYLMSLGLVKRVVIAAKLSTLEQVWLNEIFDVCMHRTALVLHAEADKRRELLAKPVDFYIVNHDGLKILARDIIAREDIDLIIVDEASAYRNAQTEQYKTLEKVAKHKKLWLLTGTPCPNAPTDAWALARLVNPSRVPPYFSQFKKQTMNQVSTYKWVPKPGSHEIAYNAMQPAIRFKKSDCLTLPPVTYTNRACELSKEQADAYQQMKTHLVLEGGAINAVNAADKIGKLRQILCIGFNTPVLTSRGWVPIQEVTAQDRVWDGIEWVAHDGLAHKGRAAVIECAGVMMTPDHEVLTVNGWCTAGEILSDKSSNRFNRAEVRLPDGFTSGWNHDWEQPEGDLAMPVRLWQSGSAREPELTCQEATERKTLRVPAWRVQPETWDVVHAPLPNMDTCEAAVYRPNVQGLAQLWRAWHHDVCRMGGFLRDILARHAGRLCRPLDLGQERQRRGVFAGELPLGNSSGAIEQHARQSVRRDTGWQDDCVTDGHSLQLAARNCLLSPEPRLAGREDHIDATAAETFDLVNCGPRNRFVVRGKNGELVIVHNCGAIKDVDGEYLVLDHAPRLKVLLEAIEEAAAKVLVIVPFKGIVPVLREEIQAWHDKRGDGRRVEVVNGDVTPRERGRIFQDFRDDDSLTELVCHPKVMAHGLNLTQADMVVLYAPIYSNEETLQVMDRINRPGQTRKMTILRIVANQLEKEIYAMVQNRADGQESILSLYKKELGLS